MPDPGLCCIAFQAEAYDTAAQTLSRFAGFTVEVTTPDGVEFTAKLRGVTWDDEGDAFAELEVWPDGAEDPTGEVRRAPLYGSLFEVV